MIFGIKVKSIILYNVLLAIATNIPVRLMTGFVVQGHIYKPSYSFHLQDNNNNIDV